MYATVLNEFCDYLGLEYKKEYRVVSVEKVDGFADTFYVLENGIKYSSSHFSVTYLEPYATLSEQ